MHGKNAAAWAPANAGSLAAQFRRLGWTGFWIQVPLLLLFLFLLVYVLVAGGGEGTERRGINLGNYASFGTPLIMLFTTLWCYRYTRLAERIADSERCPSQSSVMQALWIGVGASALGILSSMVLSTSAVLRLLFVLLATPQTGVPVVTPLGGDPGSTVSAIDALSLTALQFTLATELLVLAFSLWLLFRVTRSSPAAANA